MGPFFCQQLIQLDLRLCAGSGTVGLDVAVVVSVGLRGCKFMAVKVHLYRTSSSVALLLGHEEGEEVVLVYHPTLHLLLVAIIKGVEIFKGIVFALDRGVVLNEQQ